MNPPDIPEYELVVVMPVYNEEECVKDVVQDWHEHLSKLNIHFKIIVLNDGSRDGTGKVLEFFSANPRIEIIHKANSGHGPTVHLGYRRAIQQAGWVFQCDSDNEMSPGSFETLWNNRHSYDALLGVRTGRSQNFARKIISAVSRMTVYGFAGQGVADVNVPYRLMSSEILSKILRQIPEDNFVPNIALSAGLTKIRARIWQTPVPHKNRATGEVSLKSMKLLKSSCKAFLQTCFCVSKMKF